MDNETMESLVEAFSDENEEVADAPDADADLEAAGDGAASEDADEAEEGAEGEDADEADAAEGEPEGRKYLKVIGADGKPQRVHIDDLLGDTMHDVVVDGDKKFVSYKELRDGYQRQADYTRKTMDLAKERAELAPFAQMVAHARSDPDFVRHIQTYFQQGPAPQLQAAAQMQLADEQIAQLLDSDDKAHVARAKEILQARAQLRRVMAERQQYEVRAQHEQRQMLEAYLGTERAKLRSVIPDYDKQASVIATTLREVYGFNEAELNSVYDSRLVRLAHDAMLYRKSVEEGSKLGLEGKRKHPLPPKAAKPGAGKATSTREIRRSKDLTARAIRSGNTDDWASVIANRLGL